ncbi:DUF1015 domain-containing protein [Myxococcota bacterium]|nr:DUF1015 domain-containing protein [Myxococcota bacterium]
MAVFRPLRALRYCSDLKGELPFLISPPGEGPHPPDEGLEGVHPLAALQLTRGRYGPEAREDEPPFTHAARLLHAWKQEGILGRDPRPGFYLYEQVWDPGTGPVTRRGLVGLLRLEDFAPGGSVHPHERTLAHAREDLVQHLSATQAHLSLVMGLVADARGEVAALLGRGAEASPLVEVRDGDGILNRLSVACSNAYVESVVRAMAEEHVVLADGHHRYEVALAYRDQVRARPEVRRHQELPSDYVMALIVPDGDPGLVILPTHRVFRRLPEEKVSALHRGLDESFERVPLTDVAEATRFLHPGEPGERFVLVLPDRLEGAVLREGSPAARAVKGLPAPLRDVEVAVLRDVVFRGIMGIGPEDFPPEQHVSYVNDARTAVALVQDAGQQIGFLVRAARPEQVTAVALAGEVMPPKSTNFFPKPVKGLLINSLRSF